MKDKEAQVLFETTWRQTYEFMPFDVQEMVYTFRVVGWSWIFEDGVRRIGALHYEQLTTDAMGQTVWVPTPDEHVPLRAMAELLVKGGMLPADADLSEVGA